MWCSSFSVLSEVEPLVSIATVDSSYQDARDGVNVLDGLEIKRTLIDNKIRDAPEAGKDPALDKVARCTCCRLGSVKWPDDLVADSRAHNVVLGSTICDDIAKNRTECLKA